jgi:Spy/CpxP family protein refolding chaperone
MLEELARRGIDVGQTRDHLEAARTQGKRAMEEAVLRYVEALHTLMNKDTANDAG